MCCGESWDVEVNLEPLGRSRCMLGGPLREQTQRPSTLKESSTRTSIPVFILGGRF